MSLLMDALRRAESSKQEAARMQKEAPPGPGERLELEPLASEPARPAANPLPDLATHLDAVDADLAALPAAPPSPRQPAAPAQETAAGQGEREAVRNAFAAKQGGEPPARRPLWLVLGTLGSAGLAIAVYVGIQLNGMSGSTLAPPPRAAADTAAFERPSPPVPAVPVSPPPVWATASPSTAATTETPLFLPRPEPRPARAAPPPEAEPAAGGSAIRFTRTQPAPDASLLRGHQNLQRNDFEAARRDFELAVQRDPNNTDALLALAAIAQRQGRAAEAEHLQQRAFVANPSDPASQAAVLGGAAAGSDPQGAESRLKTLLSAQPESAQLNFALGNLYSRQQRWAEAQQAYFNAVAADGDNPDYLFNLAVSLDHLRQPRPAAQHYRLALEAADQRPAAFDHTQVRQRLAELQP